MRQKKRMRCVTEDEIDSDKYTHYVEKLKNEYDKDEPRLKKVRSLMKKTFSGRQQSKYHAAANLCMRFIYVRQVQVT